MSPNAVDGAALVQAAVQAAIRAGAPRRTVAAVAAAVAATFVTVAARPHPAATKPRTHIPETQERAQEEADPAVLLESLRAVRRAQRKRKKERAKAAKLAAADAKRVPDVPAPQPEVHPTGGAAGHCEGSGETIAAEPAFAPTSSPATLAASAAAELEVLAATGDSPGQRLVQYRVQLERVEEALRRQPEEPSLVKLKDDLTKAIVLIEDLAEKEEQYREAYG